MALDSGNKISSWDTGKRGVTSYRPCSVLYCHPRTLENILDSKATLSSLAHLLSQIPNIVISEDIGDIVQTSVANIITGSDQLRLGNLRKSYSHSRKALELSETAFFDKSLLKLLYFPDDQKYAIYIPYFLPVGFAVILSLKSLVQFFKDEMKKIKTD